MAGEDTAEQLLWRVTEARRRLDMVRDEFEAAVVAARRGGVALRPVATAAGLSHTGVAKLVERVADPSPAELQAADAPEPHASEPHAADASPDPQPAPAPPYGGDQWT